MAHYAFVFWETLSAADRIAFVALLVAILGLVLPLFGGTVLWLISLQSSRAVQAKELESQRSELALIQEYLAARLQSDIPVAVDLAALKVRCSELERRVGEAERQIGNGASRK